MNIAVDLIVLAAGVLVLDGTHCGKFGKLSNPPHEKGSFNDAILEFLKRAGFFKTVNYVIGFVIVVLALSMLFADLGIKKSIYQDGNSPTPGWSGM